MSYLADRKDTRTTRILVVEHNQVLLDALVGFLRRWTELQVVGAVREADEALACVQDLQPQVILVDFDQLGYAGLDMFRHLRVLVPDAKVIGLELANGNARPRAALAAGIDTMVSKRDIVQALLPAIRRVSPRNPSLDVIGASAGH